MKREIITDDFAWDANGLMSKKDRWLREINKSDQTDILNALSKAKKNKVTIDIVSKTNFDLGNFANIIFEMSNELEDGMGVCLFKGFNIDEVDPDDLPLLFGGISSHFGTLVTQSVGGEKIGVVSDSGLKISDKNARGSKTRDRLPFHTDRSDVIGLLCERPAEIGGDSYVVSAGSIHNEILRSNPDLLEALFMPFYHGRAGWEERKEAYPLPIFSQYKGKFAVRYLRFFTQQAHQKDEVPNLTATQLAALDEIDRLCMEEKLIWKMPFERGDMQFINNFVVLHGRAEYEDSNIDNGRRLLRSWVSSPISRELISDFSHLYGDTSAGALRGGVFEALGIVQK